ncbi:MAG TPA: hypothetical protein VF175_11125 [Lacipirellula sp.]
MISPSPHRRLLVLACCALIAWLEGNDAAVLGQRVQFPSTIPGAAPAYPATPQPSLAPALTPSPTFDPYATPGLGAPPADIPYTPPTLTPNYLQPPPIAPPAVGVPYAAPPPGGNLFQHLPTVQWNRGTYDYQNPDGSISRLQRFLQQISIEHTHLFGDHTADQLQIDRTELAATFGVPIFYNPDTPLLITPGFAFNWFEGPLTETGADLPPRTYDAYLDTAWHPRFNDFLGADLGLRTGVWTDFHAVNSDSIRILGRGLGIITLSPKMDLHAGVWYLDRNRIKLLPAGGVHWRPNPEWDAFLIFPNPKIRKRTVNIGSSQWWWYVAGEYGGGRWTVERDPAGPAGGADDDIDYNDIRVILGLEFETQTRAHGHVEVGYVFDREIIYDGTRLPPEFGIDDTVMIRGGLDF